MTARLDVTPKTTEHNRIIRTGKSEAEVTNNKKKLRSRYCTIEAMKLTTDRHEASRSLFATAELLVCCSCCASYAKYSVDKKRISSWNSPQNYETSLVNGITQRYLPPDRGDRPAFTPTGQVGTRFINPVRMKGWVGVVGWLHTEMVYPSTDGHPSWY